MSKKSAKYFSWIMVLIIGAGVLIIYRSWNTPHRDIRAGEAIKTTADQLYNSLSKEEISAKKMYLNKVVEVSGIVISVTSNQQHQQVILLRTGLPGGAVNCTMEEKAARVKPGDKVVLRGICSGYISGEVDMGLAGDVFMTRCYQLS